MNYIDSVITVFQVKFQWIQNIISDKKHFKVLNKVLTLKQLKYHVEVVLKIPKKDIHFLNVLNSSMINVRHSINILE